MSRLKIGDHVRILPKNPTPFANLEAIVLAVREHERGVRELDRYVVILVGVRSKRFTTSSSSKCEKSQVAK